MSAGRYWLAFVLLWFAADMHRYVCFIKETYFPPPPSAQAIINMNREAFYPGYYTSAWQALKAEDDFDQQVDYSGGRVRADKSGNHCRSHP